MVVSTSDLMLFYNRNMVHFQHISALLVIPVLETIAAQVKLYKHIRLCTDSSLFLQNMGLDYITDYYSRIATVISFLNSTSVYMICSL